MTWLGWFAHDKASDPVGYGMALLATDIYHQWASSCQVSLARLRSLIINIRVIQVDCSTSVTSSFHPRSFYHTYGFHEESTIFRRLYMFFRK